MNFRVTAEHAPLRCDICHQADCFDAATGACSRCPGINPFSGVHPIGAGDRPRKSSWGGRMWMLLIISIVLTGISTSVTSTPARQVHHFPMLPVSVTADPQLNSANPAISTQKGNPPKTGVVLTCDPDGHAVELSIPSAPAKTRGKFQIVRGIISSGDFKTDYSNSEKRETLWQLIVHDETRRRHWFELPTSVFESLTGRERAALDEGLLEGNRVTVEFLPGPSLRLLVLKRIRFEGRDLKRLKEMYGEKQDRLYLGKRMWAELSVYPQGEGRVRLDNLSCGFQDCPLVKVTGIVRGQCFEKGKSGRHGFLLQVKGKGRLRIFYDLAEILLSTSDLNLMGSIEGKRVNVEARTLPDGTNIAQTIEILEAARK